MPKKSRMLVKESSLADFSRVINDMGEERRKQDDAAVAKAKADMPRKKAMLTQAFDAELFDLYDTALQGGYSNPRLMVVLAEYKEAIKTEMLLRMHKKGKPS